MRLGRKSSASNRWNSGRTTNQTANIKHTYNERYTPHHTLVIYMQQKLLSYIVVSSFLFCRNCFTKFGQRYTRTMSLTHWSARINLLSTWDSQFSVLIHIYYTYLTLILKIPRISCCSHVWVRRVAAGGGAS